MPNEISLWWRVGRKIPLNVYEGDRPVCQCHTEEEAMEICIAMNRFRAERRSRMNEADKQELGESNIQTLAHCHADRDGDCNWEECPQLRDGEPSKSHRSCPLLDWKAEQDEY